MRSLLAKLGFKPISEFTAEELYQLVSRDRDRRSQQRALGRLKNVMKDARASSQAKTKERTLDNLGLSPAIIAKLRASGRSDSEIIITLKQKGVI